MDTPTTTTKPAAKAPAPDRPLMLDIGAHKLEADEMKERFYSLELLHQKNTGRALAYWLWGIFLVALLSMFLPWQQYVTGEGRVTALSPADRPQVVPSTIAGQIQKWYVQEGQRVKKGDTLLTISEVKDKYFDPQTVERLRDQVTAKRGEIQAKQDKILAYQAQITQLRQSQILKLEQARNKIIQSRLKVVSDSADNEAAKVQFQIATRQFEGSTSLYKQGLISLVQYETRRRNLQEGSAKLQSAQNKLDATRNELINAQIEVSAIRAEYLEKIAKAESDLSATFGELNESKAALAKIQNETSSTEIRFQFYTIRAPQDGFVVRALKQGIGEQVKEQDALVIISPTDPGMAVELYVKANDVPLITPGRKVRLQFDGWPVLQFAGWPSISVGTFGGVVKVVDYVNSSGGKYRILVVPDPEDDPWPNPNRLRMGSGVYGWAMLDEVRVWFELWRQLNGFPPSLSIPPNDDPDIKAGTDDKKPTSDKE
jgi:multidrug resistance efflux pump